MKNKLHVYNLLDNKINYTEQLMKMNSKNKSDLNALFAGALSYIQSFLDLRVISNKEAEKYKKCLVQSYTNNLNRVVNAKDI